MAVLNSDPQVQIIINNATKAGAFIVAGAGNGDFDVETNWFPASYDNVFSVTSVWKNDAHDDGTINSSHTHNAKVDLCAPGHHIWHALYYTNNKIDELQDDYYYDYAWGDGTSFSAPLVSGTAALMLAVNPCLAPDEIETILKLSADDISEIGNNGDPEYAGKLGAGRLNSGQAVTMASTWGNEDYVVPNQSEITWSGTIRSYGNIIVESGGILHINNSKVYMSLVQGKIIVEPGGKLFISNSSILSRPIFENTGQTCPQEPYFWGGIEVWGNPNQSQYTTSNQGFVSITNGSIIRDAICSISTKRTDENGIVWTNTGGGIIIASNSTFTNNNKHIEFMSYHNIYNGSERANSSRFSNCTFEIKGNEAETALYDIRSRLVSAWDVTGVKFEGCKFQNTDGCDGYSENSFNRGTGILTLDAGIIVQDIKESPGQQKIRGSVFDLRKGIVNNYSIQNILKAPIINNMDFERTDFGIIEQNSVGAKIYRNSFNMTYPSDMEGCQYITGVQDRTGIFFDGAGDFTVTENAFTSNYIKNENSSVREKAVVFSNTDNATSVFGSCLYTLNTHDKFFAGLQTQLSNYNLRIDCNEQTNNEFGFYLNPDYRVPRSDLSLLPPLGYCGKYGVNEDENLGGSLGRYYLWDNFNLFPQGTNSNIKDVINRTKVSYKGLQGWQTDYPSIKDYVVVGSNPAPPITGENVDYNPCPSNTLEERKCDNIIPSEPNGWEPYSKNPGQYQALRFGKGIIDEILNNGDKQSLVNLIGDPNATKDQIYDSLYFYSPFLSDRVLGALLQKPCPLSDQQVANILLLHSRLSPQIMNAVEEFGFEASLLLVIEAAQNVISTRDRKHGEKDSLNFELGYSRNELLGYYYKGMMEDTSMYNSYQDSIISFLVSENALYAKKLLIAIYLDKNLLEAAQSLIDILPVNNLQQEYERDFLQLHHDLKYDGKNIFQINETQEYLIRNIASSSEEIAWQAKSILEFVFNEFYIHLPNEIGGEEESLTTGSPVSKLTGYGKNANGLRIYPNPGDDIITVEYQFTSKAEKKYISIKDMTGRELLKIKLNNMGGSEQISLADLKSGLYIISTEGDGNVMSVKRFLKK